MAAPDQKPFPFRLEFPPELPIAARAEEIVDAIQAHQVVILAGETGSGKTTQIPKMCLAAGRGGEGRIACTQPRRVAALSVSRRVAEELGVEWGREVGCKIRFDDRTSAATVIKFLTDGMLLAEVQSDPLLRAYDTLIIDEAHERSLNIDFLLGHLRTLRYKRPELKIIITSATIDTEAFSKAFDGAPIIEVSGRTHPVEVIYEPLDTLGSDATADDEPSGRSEALHYVDGAAEAVERIVRESTGGDVLVFMPSERDIRETAELLDGRLRGLEIVPLFGRLSNSEQQRVFAPSQRRKVIIATNIAETSLTIPGIRFVVDTGLARISRYAPQARTRRLPIEPVAQSSADQRKGRAGRVEAGVCIRLYSEKDFNERPRFAQPEIQRANLADVILRLKAFGLGDIERFPFINMPAAKAIRAGYALLLELGAIAPGSTGREVTSDGDGGQGGGGRRSEAGDRRPETGGGRREFPASGLPTPASLATASAASASELTPLGRELARLPVDPTVGRMILQARTEKCLREVLIIAAGLSIQDPRERPLDKQSQADAAHRRFAHRDSDFLTLLNVWEDFHDEFERLSQARQRRFCRDHFLSYIRMREWRDIHAQLLDVLKERKDFKFTSVWDGRPATPAADTKGREATAKNEADPLSFGAPAYRSIHRSIIAGLLGNIAMRDDENGGYKATHDRRVVLFPGSVLFVKEDRKKKTSTVKPAGKPRDQRGPRWLMAAEIMETSRLYARTCARLDPAWALDLGAHLVKVAHAEPFWNEDGGRVLVKQRTRLYGLELESRAVSYGKINPVHATELFIREGLVNDNLTWPFDFLAHNREVREKIGDLLTRTRDSGYLNLDEAAYRFYAARLLPLAGDQGISAVAELVALVRSIKDAEPRFLMMEPEDLRDPDDFVPDADAFPEALPLENHALPLNYSYKPGQPDDGVTLDVKVNDAEALTEAALDWAVPGHLEEKVAHYLRALPKELRRAFLPLAETARSLAAQVAQRDRLTGRRESLPVSLAAQIEERFKVRVDPAVWAGRPPSDHLRVRVRVVDDEGTELCASRELSEIQAALTARAREASASVAHEDPLAWRQARARWEKPEQETWIFGDIPARIHVCDQAGVPVHAYPALKPGVTGVALRLMKTAEEAEVLNPRGLSRLLELRLRYELAWMQKDLRALRTLGPLVSTLVPVETLMEQAGGCISRWICDGVAVPALTHNDFERAVEQAKERLRGLVPRFGDLLREILTLRQTLLVHPTPPAGQDRDLAALLPANFLDATPYPHLAHLPRYLKAMKVRADRWKQNPLKDQERAKELAPYVAAIRAVRAKVGGERYRWLVEELRVSLFAQELGTAEPVSAVKLDRLLIDLRMGAQPAGSSGLSPTPAPILVAPVATKKKSAPVKSLGALDGLFRK